VAFLSCRSFFGFRLQVAPYVWGEDLAGGNQSFGGVLLRSGMVHGTHFKCHCPWRRAGGGSLGFFCCPRVVMVTGDLAPIGEACVRGGGCLFLWRRQWWTVGTGKWLRYSD